MYDRFMTGAKIVKKTGTGSRRQIEFELISDEDIGLEEIWSAQRELGYDPAGYGCFKVVRTWEQTANGKKYKSTWICNASCD